jgi:hypothetical protein
MKGPGVVASQSFLLLDQNPFGEGLVMRNRQRHQAALQPTAHEDVVHWLDLSIW